MQNLAMLENVYGLIITAALVVGTVLYVGIETWKMYKDLPETDEDEGEL